MSVELKVKVKSLAAEAKIIRQEEVKAKKSAQWNDVRQNIVERCKYEDIRENLYRHRIDVVRFECRCAELARAFINGVPYRTVERNTHDGAYTMGRIQGRVQKLVNKYGKTKVDAETIHDWMNQ